MLLALKVGQLSAFSNEAKKKGEYGIAFIAERINEIMTDGRMFERGLTTGDRASDNDMLDDDMLEDEDVVFRDDDMFEGDLYEDYDSVPEERILFKDRKAGQEFFIKMICYKLKTLANLSTY
jgi:hypothetical protein